MTSTVIVFIIYIILVLTFGIFAGYLSWSCNSNLQYSTLPKAFFAFIAFLMNIAYVINFYFFRYDVCNIGKEFYDFQNSIKQPFQDKMTSSY
tara:strand:+ start:852 stop:1127 length:276 start_codon:yes stop_codon:yes gene_type:complete